MTGVCGHGHMGVYLFTFLSYVTWVSITLTSLSSCGNTVAVTVLLVTFALPDAPLKRHSLPGERVPVRESVLKKADGMMSCFQHFIYASVGWKYFVNSALEMCTSQCCQHKYFQIFHPELL